MKNFLMIGTALALISTGAYATQARLLALGMSETDNDGMYYISDARNMFLNPAYINLYSNQAIVEWGSTGVNAGLNSANLSPTTLNNSAAPKAQGGYIGKYGNNVFGVYLGNESNTSSLIRAASSSAFSTMDGYDATGGTTAAKVANANSKMLQSSDNQVDIFYGGDLNGMKWGTDLIYAGSKDETRSGKDTALALRTGVIASNWDAHLNLSLISKAEATDASIATTGLGTQTNVHEEMKGKIGLQVGGSYKMDYGGRFFGYVKRYGWDQTDGATYSAGVAAAIGGQAGTVSGDFTSIYLGWGKELDLSNGDKVFTSLTAKQTNINLNFTNKSEVKHLVVPVTFGYEAKATDWLTVRGSISQNLYGERDNKNIDTYGSGTTIGTQVNKVASSLISSIYGGTGKSTIANSTTVNTGATLAFGNLTIDGLVGTTSSTGTASSKTGILSLTNLETSVGMTYKF